MYSKGCVTVGAGGVKSPQLITSVDQALYALRVFTVSRRRLHQRKGRVGGISGFLPLRFYRRWVRQFTYAGFRMTRNWLAVLYSLAAASSHGCLYSAQFLF